MGVEVVAYWIVGWIRTWRVVGVGGGGRSWSMFSVKHRETLTGTEGSGWPVGSKEGGARTREPWMR